MAQCKKCGSKDVEWVNVSGKWKLYNTTNGLYHDNECQMTKQEYLELKEGTFPKAETCRHGVLKDRWCPLC